MLHSMIRIVTWACGMQVNYWPSAADDAGAGAKEADTFFNTSNEHIEGERTKADIGDNGGKWDDFKQVIVRSFFIRLHCGPLVVEQPL